MPLKVRCLYSSWSQCSADFRNFTKKLRIVFFTDTPLPGIFAAIYKTGVRQYFFGDNVLSFSLFAWPPPQCNFSLDSNNKNMHFRRGIHQQHQKIGFSPFLSGSHYPLYSYAVGKLQFSEKKHHLFQIISVGNWSKTPSINLSKIWEKMPDPCNYTRDIKNTIKR